MLPHGRHSEARASSSRAQPSDKEEVARAALRSLSGPRTDPTSIDAPRLPRPPYTSVHPLPPPSPSSYARFHHDASLTPFQDDFHRDDRANHFGRDDGVAMTRDTSSSSFFQDQAMTASPESSPRLQSTAPRQLPPFPHPYGRHSIPSAAVPSQIHETALRRASLALGVNYQQVRHIVHQDLALRRSSHSSSSASVSTSSRTLWPHPSATQHEPSFARQVLDAYHLESERASQPLPPFDASSMDRSTHRSVDLPAPSVIPHSFAREPAFPADRSSPSAQSQSNLRSDRSSHSAWAPRSESRLPPFESKHIESGSQVARSPSDSGHRTAPWRECGTAVQRPESPSPFAYDAFRRTSHPVPSTSNLVTATNVTSRASFGSVDELARRHAFYPDHIATRRVQPPFPTYVPPASVTDNAAYERRVRSIDDYAEKQQQQAQRHMQQPRHANASLDPGSVDQHDDRLPDRNVRSSFRHSYQPYPPHTSRYSTNPPVVATTSATSESPRLSPTVSEQRRFQQIRAGRSPTAETVTSIAPSSVASVAALTPSPLLRATTSSSLGLHTDTSKRASTVDSDAKSSLRAVSVDTAAESTRAGVAKMHIDDGSGKPPKATEARSQSTRSSLSPANVRSGPIHGTDLSHSEIMQKLQDKVKSRLAARGKASFIVDKLGDNDSKGKKTSFDTSSKATNLDGSGSAKRSASSLSKSDRSGDASAQAAASKDSQDVSPPRTTTTSEKSAAPGAGIPAAKVRRTSASSQQKPISKPTLGAASKPSLPTSRNSKPPATIEEALAMASPKPPSPAQRDASTPVSIEAALLSPTDTPTPSEAAAQHAQRLSRSPLPPEGAVETASGQALPSDLPGAGQMNASSATKQQTSKSGVDSLIQTAQSNDPTETNSAIA